MGVSQAKLTLFYSAHIRSVLTYCMAAFFSMLSKTHLTTLERIQRLCTKVILPHIESYHEKARYFIPPRTSYF